MKLFPTESTDYKVLQSNILSLDCSMKIKQSCYYIQKRILQPLFVYATVENLTGEYCYDQTYHYTDIDNKITIKNKREFGKQINSNTYTAKNIVSNNRSAIFIVYLFLRSDTGDNKFILINSDLLTSPYKPSMYLNQDYR